MIFLVNFSANSTLLDLIYLYWNTLNIYFVDNVITYQSNKSFLSVFDTLPESLHFDEFKYGLLKILVLVLCVNLILIFVAWKLYGRHICERFMKPTTTSAIDELKASVAKLKLPKEHTPRI